VDPMTSPNTSRRWFGFFGGRPSLTASGSAPPSVEEVQEFGRVEWDLECVCGHRFKDEARCVVCSRVRQFTKHLAPSPMKEACTCGYEFSENEVRCLWCNMARPVDSLLKSVRRHASSTSHLTPQVPSLPAEHPTPPRSADAPVKSTDDHVDSKSDPPEAHLGAEVDVDVCQVLGVHSKKDGSPTLVSLDDDALKNGRLRSLVAMLGERSRSCRVLETSAAGAFPLAGKRSYVLVAKKTVLGFLQVGLKRCLVSSPGGDVEIMALCVFDFHVCQECQRSGVGVRLFKEFLEKVDIGAEKLAYDRPSEPFFNFLRKHFGLVAYTKSHGVVVFDTYWGLPSEDAKRADDAKDIPSREKEQHLENLRKEIEQEKVERVKKLEEEEKRLNRHSEPEENRPELREDIEQAEVERVKKLEEETRLNTHSEQEENRPELREETEKAEVERMKNLEEEETRLNTHSEQEEERPELREETEKAEVERMKNLEEEEKRLNRHSDQTEEQPETLRDGGRNEDHQLIVESERPDVEARATKLLTEALHESATDCLQSVAAEVRREVALERQEDHMQLEPVQRVSEEQWMWGSSVFDLPSDLSTGWTLHHTDGPAQKHAVERRHLDEPPHADAHREETGRRAQPARAREVHHAHVANREQWMWASRGVDVVPSPLVRTHEVQQPSLQNKLASMVAHFETVHREEAASESQAFKRQRVETVDREEDTDEELTALRKRSAVLFDEIDKHRTGFVAPSAVQRHVGSSQEARRWEDRLEERITKAEFITTYTSVNAAPPSISGPAHIQGSWRAEVERNCAQDCYQRSGTDRQGALC